MVSLPPEAGQVVTNHRLQRSRILQEKPSQTNINNFATFTRAMSNPVTISPNIQSGEPVFTNTRVPVKNLFDYLKAGHSLNEFLADFPSVKKEQAIQVIDHFENLLNFHAIANEKGAA